MKKIFSLLLLCIVFNSFAQVKWVKDMKLAQAIALSNDKFIVMDFWATWCGPCKYMDSDMWNTSKMNDFGDKFVFLKLDVDQNKPLAMGYQASSIPKVVIIDPTGNVLWNQVGYASSRPYFDVFEKMTSSGIPSTDMKNYLEGINKESAAFNIGLWYQKEGEKMKDQKLAIDFLNMSDSYLKTATKSDNSNLATEADFNIILNVAYKGNVKKAIKKVAKMDETDMKNFILAYCYKCEGQNELMTEFSKKIQSEELVSRLN